MSDKSLLDQYYTKPEVAEYYSNLIKEHFGEDYEYFEPSAGEGAFSRCFKNITSIDIEPKFDGCVRGDFLSYTPDLRNKIVVGNPPFGFCSNLALKFMNHAMESEAEAICFILPRTFEKVLFENLSYKFGFVGLTDSKGNFSSLFDLDFKPNGIIEDLLKEKYKFSFTAFALERIFGKTGA